MSAFSQLSSKSSIPDFINLKVQSISADLALLVSFRDHFKVARKRKALTKEEYDDATQELESDINKYETELVTLKQNKKTISDDIEEILPTIKRNKTTTDATTQNLPGYDEVSEAYASTVVLKIMSASSKQKKGKPFDQGAFTKAVLSYYGAKRETSAGVEKYCHITGWQPGDTVKCAHIVPKSLEGEELSYLYGARVALISEPRNGITLNHTIEGALDNGWIVFVPDRPKIGEETVWRCVLVDQSVANNLVMAGLKWRDIDGKELTFLTDNRPARRYLYLRYVVTFIHHKKMDNVKWADNVEARGYLWAKPGPYLRKSLLLILARRVSDQFLPESFYESTFTEADGCPERSPEDEEDLAMGFDLKLQSSLVNKARVIEENEDLDEDSDEE